MIESSRHYPPWIAYGALAVAIALCLGIGALGSVWTEATVRTWYQTLAKPPITPPDWVFGPVWTALYAMMGFAAWRVWRRAGFAGAPAGLGMFCIQLALNLCWSYLFFGQRMIGAAAIEIMVLWLAIFATARLFRRVDPVAAWLLVPYLAWVTYAAALNAWIWYLNRAP